MLITTLSRNMSSLIYMLQMQKLKVRELPCQELSEVVTDMSQLVLTSLLTRMKMRKITVYRLRQ